MTVRWTADSAVRPALHDGVAFIRSYLGDDRSRDFSIADDSFARYKIGRSDV
jgi:hypothetical protein